MTKYIVELNADQEKALNYDVPDIQAFIENYVSEKIRKNSDRICKASLEDESLLTVEEKNQIAQLLIDRGIGMSSIKTMPLDIKLQIVRMSRYNLSSMPPDRCNETETHAPPTPRPAPFAGL
jgi:hypothetical protein